MSKKRLFLPPDLCCSRLFPSVHFFKTYFLWAKGRGVSSEHRKAPALLLGNRRVASPRFLKPKTPGVGLVSPSPAPSCPPTSETAPEPMPPSPLTWIKVEPSHRYPCLHLAPFNNNENNRCSAQAVPISESSTTVHGAQAVRMHIFISCLRSHIYYVQSMNFSCLYLKYTFTFPPPVPTPTAPSLGHPPSFSI